MTIASRKLKSTNTTKGSKMDQIAHLRAGDADYPCPYCASPTAATFANLRQCTECAKTYIVDDQDEQC